MTIRRLERHVVTTSTGAGCGWPAAGGEVPRQRSDRDCRIARVVGRLGIGREGGHRPAVGQRLAGRRRLGAGADLEGAARSPGLELVDPANHVLAGDRAAGAAATGVKPAGRVSRTSTPVPGASPSLRTTSRNTASPPTGTAPLPIRVFSIPTSTVPGVNVS